MTEDRARRAGLLLVLLVALAVHVRALGGGWVFDDRRFVYDNGAIAEVGNPLRFLDPATADPERPPDIWRPWRTFEFALCRAFFGLDSGPWHAVSVALHGANAILLYLLLLRLGASVRGSAAGAALFAAHPATVEAVAWVSARADLWAALFVLLAAHAWIRSRGWDRWAAAAAGLGLLACFSKESAVVFPALLLAADLARPGGGVAVARARRGPLAISVAAALAYALAAQAVITDARGSMSHIQGWWGGSYGANLATAARAGAFQVLFALFPANPALDVFLPPSRSLLDAGALLAGLFLLGVLGLALRALLRGGPPARLAGGGVAAAFAAAFLTSHLLFPVGIPAAERFLYLPLGFAAWAAAAAVDRAALAAPAAAAILAVTAVGALGAISADRIAAWRDYESLWTLGPAGRFAPRGENWALEKRNREANLHLSSGNVMAAGGNAAGAEARRLQARARYEAISREAVALNDYWKRTVGFPVDAAFEARIRRNTALARLRTGDPEGALAEAQTASALEPQNARALRLQAEALEALGRPRRAGWRIERALEGETARDPVPREIAARILNVAAERRVALGFDGAALRALRIAARLVPDPSRNPAVGRLPDLEVQVEARLRALREAAARAPSDFTARAAAVIYEGRGTADPDRARGAFRAAFGAAAEGPALRTLLAMATLEAMEREEDWSAAEAWHRGTLEAHPGDAGALLGVARCREAQGDGPGATAAWRKVLADPALPPEARREAEEGIARVAR